MVAIVGPSLAEHLETERVMVLASLQVWTLFDESDWACQETLECR